MEKIACFRRAADQPGINADHDYDRYAKNIGLSL
jgi:hypothetical protein